MMIRRLMCLCLKLHKQKSSCRMQSGRNRAEAELENSARGAVGAGDVISSQDVAQAAETSPHAEGAQDRERKVTFWL